MEGSDPVLRALTPVTLRSFEFAVFWFACPQCLCAHESGSFLAEDPPFRFFRPRLEIGGARKPGSFLVEAPLMRSTRSHPGLPERRYEAAEAPLKRSARSQAGGVETFVHVAEAPLMRGAQSYEECSNI